MGSERVGPFDAVELVRWAELYGHPEGWVKRAQASHMRAERAEALLARLVAASDGRPDDPEWLEALYAARNVLRDQAKEADREVRDDRR
jgi:hypothetical protein